MNTQHATEPGDYVGPTLMRAEALDYDSVSKDQLLEEMRAMRVVLTHVERLLSASKRRDQLFDDLQRSYRAALAACALQEQRNAELAQELQSTKAKLHAATRME